jgi:hypothetical protein
VAVALVVVLVMAYRSKRKFRLQSRSINIGASTIRKHKRADTHQQADGEDDSPAAIVGPSPLAGTAAVDQWYEMEEWVGERRRTGIYMNSLYRKGRSTMDKHTVNPIFMSAAAQDRD